MRVVSNTVTTAGVAASKMVMTETSRAVKGPDGVVAGVTSSRVKAVAGLGSCVSESASPAADCNNSCLREGGAVTVCWF